MPKLENYSVPAIRVELRRRGLETHGLKSELLERLENSLRDGDTFISVPTRFKRPPCLVESEAPPTKRRKRASTNEPKPDKRVKGIWMGRSVWVMGTEQMKSLWTIADAYGKGSLSRSAPDYAQSADLSLTRGKAARQLLELERTEEELTGHAAARQGDEHLQLTLEEAFHAAFCAKRLLLTTRAGEELGDEDRIWKLFNERSEHFAERFAAYTRYRSTGWMPRSGLKYGVDWVLYKLGMQRHSHAQYCIVLRVSTNEEHARIDRSWIRLQNKLRLVKNVSKSLIIVDARFEDGNMPTTWRQAVAELCITELTVDRWVA